MNKRYLLLLYFMVHLSAFGQTPAVVDAIDFSSYETFPEVQLDGKRYLYLPEANLLIDKVENSTGNMLSVIKDGMYGAVDKNGKILAAIEYDGIELKDEYKGQWYEGISYDYEFIITEKEGKYGVINVKGREISPPQYDGIEIINKDLIGVKQHGKWGWTAAEDGHVIQQPIYDEVRKCYLNDKCVAIYLGDKQGMAKADGTVIIPPKYVFLSNLYTHSASYIACSENGLYGVLDQGGKALTSTQFEAVSSLGDIDLIKVKQGGKFGAINTQGNWIIPAEYDKIDDFVKRLAIVAKDGKQAVVDSSGKLLVPFGYDEIEFQDAEGQPVFPAAAAVMAPISYGAELSEVALKEQAKRKAIAALPYTIYVQRGEQGNRLDWSGKPIFPPNQLLTSDPFIQGGKTYYRVFSKDLYGIYDAMGKEILPMKYHLPQDQYAMTTDYNLGGIDLSDSSFIPVFDGEKLGLFNLTQKSFIVPVADQKISWINRRYLVVSRKLQDRDYAYEAALYNSEGQCIRGFDANVYDYHPVSENFFLLEREDQSLQLINGDGQVVYENPGWKGGMRKQGFGLPINENQDAVPFESGLLKISGDQHNLFIDLQARERRFAGYTAVGNFYKGLAFVVKKAEDGKDRYGVINKDGKELIPAKLEQINTVYDHPDLLLVRQDNQYGLWSREGKFLLNLEYDDIEINSSQRYVRIVKNGKIGLATKDGEIVLAPKYDELFVNYEGDEHTWPVLVKEREWYHIVAKDGTIYPIKTQKKGAY
ncbi:MAG: WG repeat-containing protein [Olivibacter sp.]|nr:WG repeat-containing protein [Olivibacter sp. UJ_SKK_5.1]